jgi:hypothetical protein
MINHTDIKIDGFVKVLDLTQGKVIHEGKNAINPETMSMVIANMLKGNSSQYIYELHLGNGGIVDGSTIKDVTENLASGTLAELYNPLYYKVIDGNDTINNDSVTRNNITVEHLDGLSYTDLIITCTLEESQPSTLNGEITFNEIGLKSRGTNGLNSGYLLTHYVSENIHKLPTSAIQIQYTLRIRL